MIGKLSGIIDSFHQGHLILDVGGVGYLVFASTRTLSQVGQVGDTLSLLIDTHVREDHIHLYGFQNAEEQRWFRLLTSVQGVGVKAGLSILSVCAPQELSLAIAAQDKATITRADGVGPKIANRILLELKNKVGEVDFSLNTVQSGSNVGTKQSANASINQDAVQALVSLGYARSEAYSAITKVSAEQGAEITLQNLITLSLKELSND